MKKIAIALLLALGTSSVANAKVFAQIDIGYGGMSIDDNFVGDSNSFAWRPTIGVEIDNHSFGIDYTSWFDKDSDNYLAPASIKVYTVGIKYAYRPFIPDTIIRPYLGVRLNITNEKNKYVLSDSSYSNNTTAFGIGAMGGIELPLTDYFAVGINAEANYLSSNVNAYEVGAFAKFSF